MSQATPLDAPRAAQVKAARSATVDAPLVVETDFSVPAYRISPRLTTALPIFVSDCVLAALVSLAFSFVAGAIPLQSIRLTPLVTSYSICFAVALIATRAYPLVVFDPAFELKKIASAAALALCIVSAWSLASGFSLIAISALGIVAVSEAVLSFLTRQATRNWLAKFAWWGVPTVIIGDATKASTTLMGNPSCGLRFAGRVTLHGLRSVEPTEFDNAFQRIETYANSLNCGCAVIAEDVASDRPSMEKLALFTRVFPRQVFASTLGRGGVISQESHAVGLGSATTISFPLNSSFQRLAKRSLDLVVASSLLIALLPFFLVAALLVRLGSPGFPFYGQRRVGEGGREFRAWKFRTMVSNADARLQEYLQDHPEFRKEWALTHKLKKDPRVTTIGWFLRTTSLDEIPQLWNVIVGEMSLVGPRPIVDSEEYDQEYIEEHPDVFTMYKWVKPGITGLWQVSGRNLTGYTDRVRYDHEYLQNWSIWLDMYILLRTVKTVLLREGAY